jgi:hypothetical protein
MVYDPATKDVVLFGGYDGSSVLGDTWVWNGSTWSKLTPSAAPSARESAAMVFDQASGQLLLFGGIVPVANAPSTFFNDTWVWTGATWQQLQPASSPPARGFASIAYDATSKNVVLFGGASQGSYLGDTWTWDGSTWAEASQTGPSARDVAAMATDPTTGHVVLFGGNTNGTANLRLADTWAWDGSSWTQRSPAVSPPARSFASMAYDPATASTVLFGGQTDSSGTSLGDTWTWDGSAWTQQSSAAAPAARGGAPATYDPTAGVVIFGGHGSSGLLADTWTWAAPTASAPTPTTISLSVKHTTTKISAHGAVNPSGARGSVKLTLYKKAHGTFVKVAAKTDVLGSGARYASSFAAPRAKTCQLQARYSGDSSHPSSSKSATFTC